MRFRYVTLDENGRERRGWIDSPDVAAANDALRQRGISAHELAVERIPEQTPPPSAALTPPERLKPTNQGEQFLLFSQLGNLLKAGFSPSHIMNRLSDRAGNTDRGRAFDRIAKETEAGSAMSDSMEQYPDLFPIGAVGAVRAGESGGYLADACVSVADAANQAKKFSKLFYWLGIFVLNTLLVFPLVLVLGSMMDAGIATINTDGQVLKAMPGALTTSAGVIGLIWLVATVVFVFLFWKWTTLTRGRPKRHRVVATAPLISKRSRGEALAHFTWHLSKLSEAGFSPIRSFQLAAEAVPNEHYRALLMHEAANLSEGDPISDAMKRSGAFPEEHWILVDTGELTGQLPSTLRDVQGLSLENVKEAEGHLKWRVGCWILLLLILGHCLAYGLLLNTYFDSMFRHVLE